MAKRGRPPGSTNKNKNSLLGRLKREFPDYHPVVEMARTANNPEVDEQTRFNANKEVAKYVTPALKAMEITGEVRGQIGIGLKEITDAEWRALSALEHKIAESQKIE